MSLVFPDEELSVYYNDLTRELHPLDVIFGKLIPNGVSVLKKQDSIIYRSSKKGPRPYEEPDELVSPFELKLQNLRVPIQKLEKISKGGFVRQYVWVEPFNLPELTWPLLFDLCNKLISRSGNDFDSFLRFSIAPDGRFELITI